MHDFHEQASVFSMVGIELLTRGLPALRFPLPGSSASELPALHPRPQPSNMTSVFPCPLRSLPPAVDLVAAASRLPLCRHRFRRQHRLLPGAGVPRHALLLPLVRGARRQLRRRGQAPPHRLRGAHRRALPHQHHCVRGGEPRRTIESDGPVGSQAGRYRIPPHARVRGGAGGYHQGPGEILWEVLSGHWEGGNAAHVGRANKCVLLILDLQRMATGIRDHRLGGGGYVIIVMGLLSAEQVLLKGLMGAVL